MHSVDFIALLLLRDSKIYSIFLHFPLSHHLQQYLQFILRSLHGIFKQYYHQHQSFGAPVQLLEQHQENIYDHLLSFAHTKQMFAYINYFSACPWKLCIISFLLLNAFLQPYIDHARSFFRSMLSLQRFLIALATRSKRLVFVFVRSRVFQMYF